MNNDNKEYSNEQLNNKNEYYIKKVEKSDELESQIKESVCHVAATVSAGLMCLGFMVANCVNTFSNDSFNPIFAVLALITGALGNYYTTAGLRSVIALISTLSAYISNGVNIKENLERIEFSLSGETNNINEEDKKGKRL